MHDDPSFELPGTSASHGSVLATPWYRKRTEALRRIDRVTAERAMEEFGARTLPRRTLVANVFGEVAWAFWLVDGRVRLTRFEENGDETALAVLEAGELFGVAPRSVRAVAETLEASTVVALHHDELRRLEETPRSRLAGFARIVLETVGNGARS